LKEKAESDLYDCDLPKKYWPLAINHANYLRNRSPAAGIDTTPIQAATGLIPCLDHLKPFGCLVWYRQGSQAILRPFHDDNALAGSFVGFDSPHIIRILSQTGRILRATAVHFQEYRTIHDANKRQYLKHPDIDDSDIPYYAETRPPNSKQHPHIELEQPIRSTSPQNSPIRQSGRLRRRQNRTARLHNASAMQDIEPGSPPIDPTPPKPAVRKSGRIRKPNVRALFRHREHQFSDTNFDLHNQLDSTTKFALFSTTINSLTPVNQFSLLAEASPAETFEPRNWKAAQKHPSCVKWMAAAQEEYNSLMANGTWRLVEPPQHQKVLAARWVFKYKRGSANQILRYKARWVVKGYEQIQGVDYDQTFASVVKPMSYKALFAIAASLDLEIEQMDVKTAFLYGAVEEDIYVNQPEGYNDNTGRVCKLNKALYGLKQSPRVWYATLAAYLLSLGFKALDADSSVFIRDSTYIAVYVDDLLITGPDLAEIDSIKLALSKRFSMSDLGPVAFYLGMTITRDRARRILRIGQQAYLAEAIRNAGVWDAVCPLTPMETTKLQPAGEEYDATPGFKTLYQSYVGTLMYAMLGSRPDIAFAVSSVSRYAANPTQDHMAAVLRIFTYLHGTLEYQLTYRGELAPLSGFSDSDWAGDTATSRSTSGFVFNLGSGAISWSAKRQPTVSLSTCEAEYAGQTQASKEAVWLRQLLRGLNPADEIPYATIIYCDNQGAIALAKDPRFHPRTKHIGIQHHWIREKIGDGTIKLEYVTTAKQVADGLTKPLPKGPFEAFRTALGLEAC
jgi:Reverse transcriptase (RNA-dependent DNA polymerase)